MERGGLEEVFAQAVGADLGALGKEQSRINVLQVVSIEEVGDLALAGRGDSWNRCSRISIAETNNKNSMGVSVTTARDHADGSKDQGWMLSAGRETYSSGRS